METKIRPNEDSVQKNLIKYMNVLGGYFGTDPSYHYTGETLRDMLMIVDYVFYLHEKTRQFRVDVKLQKHGGDAAFNEVIRISIPEDEDIQTYLDMRYGCWYDIISYECMEIFESVLE